MYTVWVGRVRDGYGGRTYYKHIYNIVCLCVRLYGVVRAEVVSETKRPVRSDKPTLPLNRPRDVRRAERNK